MYKLIVQFTSKSGEHHYQVIDGNGVIHATRISKRKYAACTINGQFFFGRLDLIGKGDHGRTLAQLRKDGIAPHEGLTIAQLEPSFAKEFLND